MNELEGPGAPPVEAATVTQNATCLQLDDNRRLEVLSALLSHTRDEMTFWRTRNWSALRSAIVGMAAVASVSVVRKEPLSDGETMLCALTVCGVALVHNLYQWKNVRTYGNLKSDLTRILRALGVEAPGLFLAQGPLFEQPAELNHRVHIGTPSFMGLGWVFAVVIVMGLYWAR